MHMEEFEVPLVIFTLMTQWGIGSLLALTLCQRARAPLFTLRQLRGLTLGVWCITVTGSIASLAHLGSPTGACRALYGIGHSWLSREVVAFTLLNGVMMMWLIATWRFPRYARPLGWLAIFVGGVSLLISAQVYAQIRLHALWYTIATPLSFVGSAVLLGFSGVALVAKGLGYQVNAPLKYGWLIGLALVALALVLRFQLPEADASSPLFWWQLFASLLVGAALLASINSRLWHLPGGFLCLLVVVSGELAGRLFFYSNVMHGFPWFWLINAIPTAISRCRKRRRYPCLCRLR